MEEAARRCDIGRAKLRREVELRSFPIAVFLDGGSVIRNVKGKRPSVDKGCVVDFVVWPWGWRLGVLQDRLNHGQASEVVSSGCADGIVAAIQLDSVGWISRPREVLVGTNDAHYLVICVRDGVQDFIRTHGEFAGTSCWDGDMLGRGEGDEGEGSGEGSEDFHYCGSDDGGRKLKSKMFAAGPAHL